MLTFLLFQFVVHSGLAAQCDRDVGPSGHTECIQRPGTIINISGQPA